jgi:hypothetical protein
MPFFSQRLKINQTDEYKVNEGEARVWNPIWYELPRKLQTGMHNQNFKWKLKLKSSEPKEYLTAGIPNLKHFKKQVITLERLGIQLIQKGCPSKTLNDELWACKGCWLSLIQSCWSGQISLVNDQPRIFPR